ncbi:MAG: hypothetical protein J6U92_03195 [Clostridia bacterium]|nr:hypothetical protein [Clostridia bacterium]
MTKSIKKIFYVVLTCVLLLSSICLLSTANKVYADSVASSLQMEKGASVRISSDEKELGIRYAMIMSEEEYSGINKKVSEGAISDVSYGILIAPAYYNDLHALNKENVFGYDGAKVYYNWSVDGKYTEETGKVRITNLTSKTLGEYEYKDGYVGMFASIVDLEPENIANEFIGVGYIQYTLNGKVEYQFTDSNDNVRSMALVAQTYIEKNPNDDCNAILQTAYLDKVVSVESKYTTEYYLENAEGEFVKADTETEETLSTIGATITPVQKEILGYYFDLNNENNSVATKVLANDKTVLKLYYKKATLNADGTFFNSDFELTEKLASSPCATPLGWIYDGGNDGWNYYATNGELRFNGYEKRIESVKLPLEAGKAVSASVDGYVNGGKSYFNICIYFYDANGVLIQTNKLSSTDISLTNTAKQTYNTETYVSPEKTAFVSMGIAHGGEGNVLMFVDNAKLNVVVDNGQLNADGTFFNSDFSIVTTPSTSPCALPFGWDCKDLGDNAGYNYFATSGELRFNGYEKKVTSKKFAINAGELISANIDIRTDGSNVYFNMKINFYGENGDLVQTKAYSSDVVLITTTEVETLATQTFVVPENAVKVSLDIEVGTAGLAYVDNAKIFKGISA